MKSYFFYNGGERPILGKIDTENIEKELGANFIDTRYKIDNILLSKINKIHTSVRLNERLNLPLKYIWNKWDVLNNCSNHCSVILFTDASIRKIDLRDLNRLKRTGASLYLLFLNTVERPGAKYAFTLSKKFAFKKIFTIDRMDAIKYGFNYTNQVYLKNVTYVNQKVDTPRFDLFFVGMAKDRLDLLHSIYKKLVYINKKFFITDVPLYKQIPKCGIEYNNYIGYEKVLDYIMQSNCILEVVQGVQTGLTYRVYEALCYNKKLLTNNQEVLNLPFYNKNYIHFFEKPEDIDPGFISEKTAVNYWYNDEYSPYHLFEKIKELEE